MKHILEVDGIQLEFNNSKILLSVYIKCETGKITGLLGKNGTGKSCLMRIINKSLDCESSIRIDGKSINQLKHIHKEIHYAPQHNFIPKHLTLKTVFSHFSLSYSLFEIWFPEFSSKSNDSIGVLSGGERRIVELYIIVKSKTKFVLLDEPFTHLSPIQIERLKELILEEKSNKGFLLTDHLYQHIMHFSDNLYLLKDGRTILINNKEEIEALGYARL
jgi:ABC-type multidrug transport system ATPase subunit